MLPLTFGVGAAAAAVGAHATTLGVLIVGLGAVAFAFQVLKVLTDALVQESSPDEVRGRVFSVYDLLYNVAFILAGLALIPLWESGRETALLWMLAVAFAWPERPWRGVWTCGRSASPPPPRAAPGPAAGGGGPIRGVAVLAGALPTLAFPAADLWVLGAVGLVPVMWLVVRARLRARRAVAHRGRRARASSSPPTTGCCPPSAPSWFPSPPTSRCCGSPGAGWPSASCGAGPPSERSWPPPWWCPAPGCWPSTCARGNGWVARGPCWAARCGPARPCWALASVGGVWLLSFALVAVNVAVTAALLPGVAHRPSRVAGAGLAALTALAVWGFGAARPSPPVTAQVTVVGVQPGVVHGADDRFDEHLRLSRELVGEDLDLVVWAESSVGFDLEERTAEAERLAELSEELGAPILVNVDSRRGGGGIFKSSVLVDGDGLVDRYDKMRLVPFGEYIPLRPAFGWVGSLTDAAEEDRRRGDDLVIMDADGIRIGPLVCFESAFPDLPRSLAERGVDLIVLQTATTTFQGSWAQDQHAAVGAVRAVESGRPVVHSAVSGVTAVFDAEGRLLTSLDNDETGIWTADVDAGGGRTPYVRWGDWVPVAALLILTVAALVAGLRAARRGRPTTPAGG